MYLVLFLSVAALLRDCRSADVGVGLSLLDIDNNIQSNDLPTKTVPKRFVFITQRPEPIYDHKQEDVLQIVCEALAAPAPSIRWFKNNAPVYELGMESNEVKDTNEHSVGRMSSTLLVSRSSRHDEYTCVVKSGTNITRACTTVYSTDGSMEPSERSKLYPLAPHILVWYRVYVDIIGSRVVLPCRAQGHPRPRIVWRDRKGNLVKNDPRMKVLRSGELVISSLRWPDLGEYTCQASNVFGTTSIKTFIYPAKE